MASVKWSRLIEFMVRRCTKPTVEEMCEASGLTPAGVSRLLRNDDFLRRLTRRAGQKLLAELPYVLASLARSACTGSDPSAIKLFIDSVRENESPHRAARQGARRPGACEDIDELLEDARSAGIDTRALRRLALSATTLKLADSRRKGGHR